MKKVLLIVLFTFLTQSLFGNIENLEQIGSKKIKGLKLLSNVCRIRLKGGIGFVKQNNIFQEIKAVQINPLLKNKTNSSNIFLNKTSEQVNSIKTAEEPLLRTYIIEYNDNSHPEDYCKYLIENFPQIEIAEPYYIDEILDIPNDPYATSQTMLSRISAFDAWDYSKGDSSVIIGISDNGVYQEHQDLMNSIAPNWDEIPYNGLDDDENGYIDDFFGYNFAYIQDGTEADYTYNPYDAHGTNVAGVAAATTNNNIGIAGVSYNCRFFPIKAASNQGRSIIYGYESILYAAARGLKVLNCSWGSVKPFSQIDQSIIDYAISNDVAIVAAGGNYEDFRTEMWYPAGYFGVLGVGEVAPNDILSSSSSIGVHTRIMAPGQDNISTNNQNSYETLSVGTSFASPVVAGALGVIRAKYPELDPIQAIEFTRQSVDDIREQNYEWRDIIPGRLNLLKAMTTNPNSIPGIQFIDANYSKNDGTKVQRFLKNDTVLLSVDAFNRLAEATELKFELSAYGEKNNSIIMIDSIVNRSYIDANSPLNLEPFRFFINASQTTPVFFKVTVTKTNSNYSDFFLFSFVPTSDYVVFENNIIKFSASDKGTIGYGSTQLDGIGFNYKDKGNQIYDAGIMAVSNSEKVISSLFGWNNDYNDFSSVQQFLAPANNVCIIDDSETLYDSIGIEVTQHFSLPNVNSGVAKIRVKIRNRTEEIINDLAVGYLFDWDVAPNEDSNKVSLFPEAIPSELAGINIAAECAEYATLPNYPVFGSIVYSELANTEAQATGMDYDMIRYFQKSDQIRSLNSGTSIQHTNITDVNYVMGMKFFGEFLPNEERTFVFCFGGADSKEALAKELKECLLNTGIEDNLDYTNKEIDFEVYPNPACDFIRISIKSKDNYFADLKILNMLGNEMIIKNNIELCLGVTSFSINTLNLPTGNYLIQITTNDSKKISKIISIIK